jgi:hypothetical protein
MTTKKRTKRRRRPAKLHEQIAELPPDVRAELVKCTAPPAHVDATGAYVKVPVDPELARAFDEARRAVGVFLERLLTPPRRK